MGLGHTGTTTLFLTAFKLTAERCSSIPAHIDISPLEGIGPATGLSLRTTRFRWTAKSFNDITGLFALAGMWIPHGTECAEHVR